MSMDCLTWVAARVALAVLCTVSASAQPEPPSAVPPEAVRVKGLEGTNLWVLRKGARTWTAAARLEFLEPQDRVLTRENTRLTLLTPSGTVIRIPQNSEFQIPSATRSSTFIRLLQGWFFFFHRGEPTDLDIQTPTSSAAVLGTDFVVALDKTGTMRVTVLAGKVQLANDFDRLQLTSGEEGVAEPGRPPEKRPAALYTMNRVQWCLYYPAVLDLDELDLAPEAKVVLEDSLTAYRRGDILAALASYPAQRQPQSPAETVYLGALLLAVGQVTETEALLEPLTAPQAPEDASSATRLARALKRLVAAVKLEPLDSLFQPRLATEWLAESYYRQAHSTPEQAREAARAAVNRSPTFGFGWARVAELEFSFAETRLALRAVRESLALSPRNAQAWTVQGFLHAAQNKLADALDSFNAAIAIDPGLGNAWLGRGLVWIRRGEVEAGLTDLKVAAALEPQRALLRSYLGKAFGSAGDRRRAEEELRLARKLDRDDPTAWLYSALLLQQNNRINEAIADLEKSKDLNENRRVYRSRLLLDQDRAVRGANLASLYEDAGMTDVSAREAALAVASDYANYSAHLFLANSYNQLRDPNQVSLRYETAWLSEYLVANLLAPVGASPLSPTVSQQEYARLFERDRLGLVSWTEYTSNGDWIESGAQYGTYRNLAYALNADYRSLNGQRQNNDFEQLTLSAQVKYQITPQDSVFLHSLYYNAEGGDLAQVYDPTDPNEINTTVRVEEDQEPLLLLGYHREWRPGHHSLLLAARLDDTLRVNDPNHPTIDVLVTSLGTNVASRPFDLDYRSDLEIYSVEGQQIWQHNPHTLVAGARYQFGDFKTQDQMTRVNDFAATNVTSDFDRFTAYGYYQILLESLNIEGIAGLTYDHMTYPVNYRVPPVSGREDTVDQLSPKAGLIWTPTRQTSLRAAYSRSLGGVSFDQSFRLEPSQVAGFNQAFRSVIPESVVGSTVAPQFDLWAVELDQRFPTRTYFAIKAELLQSEVDQEVGGFSLTFPPPRTPAAFQESLDYEERTLTLSLHQLLGDEWALGSSYRLSQATLEERLTDLPTATPADLESILHQVRLFALFNHPSGLFAQADALWSQQSNRGYEPDRPGDEFWQFNAFVGYRFPRRRAELRLGVLNLTDQDYRLNPLNLTAPLPRERTFVTSLRLNF